MTAAPHGHPAPVTEPLDLFADPDGPADPARRPPDASPPDASPPDASPADASPVGADAPDLDTLRERAAGCTRCELYEGTTGTVFGTGPRAARLMMVGEQPGDQEDRALEPFVGPAGQLLDRALVEAGVDRDDAYVTNAVKHFSFRRQGNRRIHQTPRAGHIRACRPWLDAELELVRPHVLVTLGATAGKALLGPSFRITAERGAPRPWNGVTLLPTIHPSAILRADDDTRAEMEAGFVADLRHAGELLAA